MTEPLVHVRDLTVRFVSKDATVHAVNGVDFEVNRGEVVGLLAYAAQPAGPHPDDRDRSRLWA